ncbi:glycosyltransferase involved in cell wall biosynthesis [Arcicella aurantiaca]|uniref:Glycosyltransferase involved in cell wall biosynthesis n=1 Tax=Arcicella aurantiaca TaxID=591202 RepID=A0A316DXC8_9BACT|nr:glycosyltransferase family 4 protein [Arcicella aurantiaca]PWK22386.1 glycosyltransferase involved in cell wall biosynthesis [Arcicella aurantiaca]
MKALKTILQIHNQYIYKGGEDSVFDNECEMLRKKSHHVIKLTANNENIRNIIKCRKEFYEQLDKILLTEKIDVAHIHNIYHIIGNKIFEVLAKHKIPIVQTLHNFRFLCPAGLFLDNQGNICEKCSNGNFSPCVLKKCYQTSYVKSLGMAYLSKGGRSVVNQYVNQFIALNTFSRNKFIQNGFNESTISVKSNFLSTTQLHKENKSEYFLYVGRLSHEKGIKTLIEAFIGSNFPLVIAGSGSDDYLNPLKKLTEKSKNIQFVGYVSGQEKEELIRNAIALIIPSNCYENFPMSILEAYRNQKSVIVSNIGGLPSIVKDGNTGLLFEVGNSNSLKNAVNLMTVHNNFNKLGQAGYSYFLENFTEERNYKQLIEIYQKAIENRAKQ